MRTLIALTLLALSGAAQSDVTPFLGKWNMTGTGDNTAVVYWLEVKQEGGVLKGRFLNRASSPYDLPNIKVENGELVFSNAAKEGSPAPPTWRGKIENGRLVGTTTIARRDPAQPPRSSTGSACGRRPGLPPTPTASTPTARRSRCSTARRWTRGACSTSRTR